MLFPDPIPPQTPNTRNELDEVDDDDEAWSIDDMARLVGLPLAVVVEVEVD